MFLKCPPAPLLNTSSPKQMITFPASDSEEDETLGDAEVEVDTLLSACRHGQSIPSVDALRALVQMPGQLSC